jgi:hypothetical protein
MRPRFRLPVPIGPEQVIERLEDRLAQRDCPCTGAVAGNHQVVELSVPEADRTFWSPSLSLTVAKSEQGSGSVVHVLVGPNPNLWTLFAMTYMGLLTLLTFVGIFGLIQWWLGLDAWGLLLVPLLIGGIVAMYAVSCIGQRLAAEQTALLRRFVEDVVSVDAAGTPDRDTVECSALPLD